MQSTWDGRIWRRAAWSSSMATWHMWICSDMQDAALTMTSLWHPWPELLCDLWVLWKLHDVFHKCSIAISGSGSSSFAHIISRLLLALLYSRSHGWRRSCRACGGQRKRNVQGRLCRWWCSTSSFPIHCWPAKDAWNHGWHGPEGQLCRRRGAEQARCADLEVSHWAWHRHQLGWHGALVKST